VIPSMFSAVRWASGSVFMFCALELIFGGTEGVYSCFHVLRSRARYRRNRGRRLSFSCFAIPGTFSAVRRASGLDLTFCATRLIFGGIEGVGSRFHVLRARIFCRRYRGIRVPFSCFTRPDSYSVVPMASGLIFMFCASGHVFGGTEGVRSRFHVWAPGHIFGGTEGVRSRFHVLHSRTHFRRYRGRRFPFYCFARPDSFSSVPRASGPVFMFCALGLIFDSTEGVRSRFYVLTSQTRFRRNRGRRLLFHVFRSQARFRRYGGRRGLI
jgi:hypothetical protein